MKKFDTVAFDLTVDARSAVPIYQQIKDAIKMAVFSGKLKDGDKIVSIRHLAARFNINPVTIMKAYGQLETDGYLFSRRGAGYYIRMEQDRLRDGRREIFEKEVQDFLKRIIDLGYTVEDFRARLDELLAGKDKKNKNKGMKQVEQVDGGKQ